MYQGSLQGGLPPPMAEESLAATLGDYHTGRTVSAYDRRVMGKLPDFGQESRKKIGSSRIIDRRQSGARPWHGAFVVYRSITQGCPERSFPRPRTLLFSRILPSLRIFSSTRRLPMFTDTSQSRGRWSPRARSDVGVAEAIGRGCLFVQFGAAFWGRPFGGGRYLGVHEDWVSRNPLGRASPKTRPCSRLSSCPPSRTSSMKWGGASHNSSQSTTLRRSFSDTSR